MKAATYKTRRGAQRHLDRCAARHPSRVFRIGEDMDLSTWDTVFRVYMDARAPADKEPRWVVVGPFTKGAK